KTIQEGDDSKKSFKRLHRFRYSPTAAYGNNEVHLHPYKSRRLSAAEALAIQSLPKEFQLPPKMTLSDMFKTIGNGVPYLASEALAKTIRTYLESL
ncbi:DNA cytosine methyltransferase, partial [Vibrio vulnificus]